MNLPDWRETLQSLKDFPWLVTARTLQERFREDRLGLTASSLTFTTIISLVPLFTVLLAVFSAFPAFGKLQGAMQQWMSDSLFPESIARQVMGYLTQFSAKASRVGAVGFGFLVLSALSLVLTIDRTLNGIWRVRRPRPLAQRVLMYWAVLTLGPLALAALLALTSYAVSSSRGLVQALPAAVKYVFDLIEFGLVVWAVSGLFRFVPNTHVKRRHALAGALFFAIGLEVAKKGLALYLGMMPGMSAIYGAFVAVPILLLWIYIVWVLVLLGAVIAAYLPSLMAGVERRGGTPGWQFQLAVEAIQALDAARSTPEKGMNVADLALRLRVESLQLEPAIDALVKLDWVGQLEDGRQVLLVDLDQVEARPLINALLLGASPSVDAFVTNSRISGLKGLDLIRNPGNEVGESLDRGVMPPGTAPAGSP
ncbi:MAG: YihY family inner membrane protein [Burkholderiaceae bacterium]|nr:YihY family inner membrane protein [Burkholderiaceae bacterium]